jgi:hypothetical protein
MRIKAKRTEGTRQVPLSSGIVEDFAAEFRNVMRI